MRRPALALLPFLLLAGAVVHGCGGGGGGNPDPNPNPGGTVSDLSSVRTSAIRPGTDIRIDATNLFPGEAAEFRLSGVLNGTRITRSFTGWSTNVPASVGTITNDGRFIAGGTAGSGTVSVTVNGTTYTANVTVKGGGLAIVTGRVRTVAGALAELVEVRLLNAAGAVVASGFSGSDGQVRIGSPTSAVRLNLNFDRIDPGANFYVRQYSRNGTDYSTAIAGCTSTIPGLTVGGTTSTGDAVVYLLSASSPPPPPDGCNQP